MTESAEPVDRRSPQPARQPDEADGLKPKESATSASSKLFNAVVLALTIVALYVAQEILLPIALAIFLSFLLAPVVTRLERLRIGRIAAVIVACAFATVVVGGVTWVVYHQFDGLMADLPKYEENLLSRVRSLRRTGKSSLEKATETFEDISKEFQGKGDPKKKNKEEGDKKADGKKVEAKKDDGTKGNQKEKKSVDNGKSASPRARTLQSKPPDKSPKVTPGPESSPKAKDSKQDGPEKKIDDKPENEADDPVSVNVVSMPESPLRKLQNQLGPFIAPLTTGGLVLVLLVFILVQREDVRNRLIHLVGTAHVRATTEALRDSGKRLSRYLRMQLLINAFCGIVVGVGLSIIGLPNALMWGVLAFLLRYLPYVGPWVAATLPIAVSLAVFPGWTEPLLTIALFIALELVANNVLEPWLYGSSIGVSSLGIIIAAIFWTWLWGAYGLVLAMPLTVCLIVAGSYVPQLRFLTVLFGDGSMLPLEHRIYQRLLSLDDEEASQLVKEFLKTGTVDRLYHAALLPALHLAERDRHAGVLSDAQEKFVIQSVRDLVEELDDAGLVDEGSAKSETANGGRRVLCIPARDEADTTAAMMLTQLLRQQGADVEQGSIHTSAGEWIERLRTDPVDAVVISALPPLGARDGRYLCKRLRHEHPDLPIIVGVWTADPMGKTVRRLNEVAPSDVVVSLTDAVEAVRRSPIAKRDGVAAE